MNAQYITRGMDMQMGLVEEIEDLIKQAPTDVDIEKLELLKSYTSNLRMVCEFTRELLAKVEKEDNTKTTKEKPKKAEPKKDANEDLDFLD